MSSRYIKSTIRAPGDFDRVVTLDEKVLLEKNVKHRYLFKQQLQKQGAYGVRSAGRKCYILPHFAVVTC